MNQVLARQMLTNKQYLYVYTGKLTTKAHCMLSSVDITIFIKISRIASVHANITPFFPIVPSLLHVAFYLPESTKQNACALTICNIHY